MLRTSIYMSTRAKGKHCGSPPLESLITQDHSRSKQLWVRKLWCFVVKILTATVCYLSLFLFVLLYGCSTSRRDGPPSYNVDVSRIPNAVPKFEPLSRIGNKPYTVLGKKYYILSS